MRSKSHHGKETDALSLEQFKKEYAEALKDFAKAPTEEQLLRASELGKWALDSNIGLLDITAVHMGILAGILKEDPSKNPSDFIRKAESVLLDCLSPFEMSARGFLDKLEEAKKKSEQDVKAIFASAQDGIVLLDEEGAPLDFNKAFANMLGYSLEELKEINMGQVAPGVFALDEQAVAQLLENGYFDDYERVLARRDGSELMVTLSGAMIGSRHEGEPGRAFAFVKDITERKKAEQEVQRYRDLLEETGTMAKVGGWEFDVEDLKQVWTSEVYRIHEVDPESFQPTVETGIAFYSPEVQEEISRFVQRAIEKGEGFDFEMPLVTALGNRRWVHAVGRAHWEGGKTTKVLGTFQDITDRKQAEEALGESEERYRQIFENAIEGIFQSTLDGKILSANPAFARMFGYDSPELVMREVTDMAAQLYSDPGERAVITSMLMEKGMVSGIEVRFKDRDGTPIWVSLNAHVVRNENGDYLEGTTGDITERKRAEAALQAAERKYRELAESLPQVVFELDVNGKVTYVNQNALEEFGYSREEFESGIHALDVISAADKDRVDGAIYKMYSGQSTGAVREYAAKRRDGTEFPCIVYSTLITDTVGNPVGIRGILADVSEQKRAEMELQRVNTELEGFAQTVSHDLRGPLSAVGLASQTLEVLLNSPQSDETQVEVKEILKVMSNGVEKSSNLIEDILTLAEAGQVPTALSVVDVGQVVHQILEERAGVIEKNGIVVNVAGDLGEVTANPTHVYQLFSNLIANAIRHNDSRNPRIVISRLGDDEGGRRRYLVRDNGSGVPEDDLDDIFIPFFKGETGGTGIGLSTVEKIVMIYGGSIKAYNDNGACFEFSIGNPGDA